MSVGAIHPIYTQATSPKKGSSRSGMPSVAIIRPRCRINTPFCPEWNGKYDGECFISLSYIVFGIWTCKFTIFFAKFDFWSPKTGPNIELQMKAYHQSQYLFRVICRSFPLSSTTLSLEINGSNHSSMA